MHIKAILESAGSRHSSSTPHDATALVNRLRPIIVGFARTLGGGDDRYFDDYCQEGALAICLAVGTHDPDRGQLDHYAVFCARRHMLKRKRWHKMRSREIAAGHFSDYESDEEVSQIALEAREKLTTKATDYRLSDVVDASLVWEIAALVLTRRELDVIHLIYISDLLPSETAAKLGISAPRVTQLAKSALAKLRNAITTPFSLN